MAARIPTTVADWRLAEIRGHIAALPEGHAGKIDEKDANRIERIANAIDALTKQGAGGIDVLRDLIGVYDSDQNVKRIALSVASDLRSTSAKLRSLLPPE